MILPCLDQIGEEPIRAVHKLRDYLEVNHITPSLRIAEELVSDVLDCPRLQLYLHPPNTLSTEQQSRLKKYATRLAQHEPIQYILGTTNFMGNDFKIDDRALIPRPETECLVEQVLNSKAIWKQAKPIIVDVGTGTGCITITLAKEQPHAQYIGLDISTKALQLAQENAQTLGVERHIQWIQSDLLTELNIKPVDAIIANLPYIPTKEYRALPDEINRFEPQNALDAGKDGLRYIEQIIHAAPFYLKPNGHLFLEIGEEQGSHVKTFMEQECFQNVHILKDLAKRDRIAHGARNSNNESIS
ncbi:MAG: peptide chain release factor N(5)-glutamine methyltransferase [Kiritimatiellae bacterium]|nr:peptide chain release factor N(5)-glutamine methyltransferase [Kiritimatiellia bacterium]